MLTAALALFTIFQEPTDAPPPAPPRPAPGAHEHVVARAMSDFGFDLHRALAAEAPNEDLFVAPYSLARTLAIVAEGARGETAREFATALRWPAEALMETPSGPRLRADVAHAGLADFARRIENVDGASEAAIWKRIEEVRAEFHALSAEEEAERAEGRLREVERIDEAGRDDRAAKRAEVAAARARYEERFNEQHRLEREFHALLRQLPGHSLDTVRSLWLDSTWTIDAEHLALIETHHGQGILQSAPFRAGPATAHAVIAEWFRAATGRPIGALFVPADIDSQTRLVQLDALDFAAGWAFEFSEYWTKPAPFEGLDGTSVEIELMQSRESYRYAAFEADGTLFETPRDYERGTEPNGYPSAGGFQVIELPYRGQVLAFLLFVPLEPRGLPALEARLSGAELERFVAALEVRWSEVQLPRFAINCTRELDGALRALGVVRAFEDTAPPLGADFSGCVPAHAEGLVIDLVRHHASISVDERGTIVEVETIRAARRRGVAHTPRVPFVPIVRADHPFLFVVIDRATNAALFVGRKARG